MWPSTMVSWCLIPCVTLWCALHLVSSLLIINVATLMFRFGHLGEWAIEAPYNVGAMEGEKGLLMKVCDPDYCQR